jgi:hypothetical protein
MAAIIGDVSITTADETVLRAGSDLALAWKWAEHEVSATRGPTVWAALDLTDQSRYVAEALAELRRAYDAAT